MTDNPEKENWYAIRDLEMLSAVEQFYFHEARLLDNRQFQQWMSLLSEDVSYTVPARFTPSLDPTLRDTEAVLNVEQELSSGMEPPLRDDNYLTLMIRATRSFKINAWGDNPPARTRRFVSNVEVFASDQFSDGGQLRCFSNVMMSYSRHDKDNAIFTYHREDHLISDENGYVIKSRNVLLDWNVVTAPTVALLF